MDAKYKERRKRNIYEAYIAEAVRNISENAAYGSHHEGATYMGKSYLELIDPSPETRETADDIISRISNKLENL